MSPSAEKTLQQWCADVLNFLQVYGYKLENGNRRSLFYVTYFAFDETRIAMELYEEGLLLAVAARAPNYNIHHVNEANNHLRTAKVYFDDNNKSAIYKTIIPAYSNIDDWIATFIENFMVEISDINIILNK